MPASVDLITHGSGEGMYYCLNAMAAFFHGGRGSFVGGLMLLTGMFGATYSSLRMVREFNIIVPVNWFIGYMLLLTAMTIPKANVTIIDRVTGFQSPVANVPYLFAIPAGYLSQIGDLLAKKADQCFSVPAPYMGPEDRGRRRSFADIVRYRRNGVAMTAKLIANASHFNFINYDLANNMREFVKECVYYDLALGKYTVNDLQNSDDLWRLVSERPSPHGGMFYRTRAVRGVTTEWLSCRQGVEKLNAAWVQEITNAKTFYGKKLFPYARANAHKNPSDLLAENLVGSYEYLTGISKSADYFMQQNIMRNAIEDGFLTKAQEDGAAASIQSYAIAKAEAQQEASYAIQGGLAQKSVAIMRIVIELIFMGMFPFVAIVSAIPMCSDILRTYLVGLMWLQSWAPLYSVINMIVLVYSRGEAMTATSTLTGNALTFDTIPSLGISSASVAKYAGYAMMSVPFLSWGIFKYGGGALSQMAAHWAQPVQTAASSAASEITTGNISQGVRQFDVEGRNNATRFKQDENVMVASGAATFQSGTGSMVTVTPDGRGVINRSAEISRLGIGINSKDDVAASFGDLAQNSLHSALASSEGYQRSMNAAFNQMQHYRTARDQSMSSENSRSNESSVAVNKAFSKLDDITQGYMQQYGVDRDTAVRELSSNTLKKGGGISISTDGIPVVGQALSAVGVKAEAHIGGEHASSTERSTSDATRKHESVDDKIQQGKQFREAMEQADRAIQTDVVRNNNNETRAYASEIHRQIAQAENYHRGVQASLTNAKSYQESAQLIQTRGVGVSEDLSQEFVDWASTKHDRYGSVMGIGGVQEAMQDPEQRRALVNEYISGHREQIMQQFGVHKPHDRTGVEQHYKDSNKTVPGENEIVNSNTSKTAESAINYRVNRNKLDIPVNESAKVRAQQFLEKVEKGLIQKQNAVKIATNEMQTAKQRIEDKVKE